MAGIARNIELYNSAFSLAWKHISERQKRERPNIARLLHDSIRGQLKDGATDPLFIASEALKALEESEPEPPKVFRSAEQPLPFSLRWPHLIRQKKGPGNNAMHLALTTAYPDWEPERDAVLKITFAELLPFLFSQYIARMLWRVRNSRGRPLNVPARFHPPVPANRRQVSRLDAVWAAILIAKEPWQGVGV